MAKHTFQMTIEVEIEGPITQKNFFGFVRKLKFKPNTPSKRIKILKTTELITMLELEYPKRSV